MRLSYGAMVLLLLAGCAAPSLLITPVANKQELQEITVQSGKGWWPKKLAIIEVEGLLLNARSGGFLQAQENRLSLFVQQMEKAGNDNRVRAVVLRINSPGGTVTASDTMYQTVVEFRQKTGKPVIASGQDVCASGAYYVACGADKIVVHPTSVVGSIGVVFNTFEIQRLMDKVGVRSEAIKSGALKDMGSPFRPRTAQEREVLQGLVNEYYNRFVSVVSKRRSIGEGANLQLISDGRVFSGQRAVELGLADVSGSLDDALQLAKEMGKAEGAAVVMYKRPYGYSGSIYASSTSPGPQTNVMHLDVPWIGEWLPSGFYFLWDP